MNNNVIISGSGGQGVLSAGTILANIFMLEDKFVSFSPCYGAEMRGGTVNCEVNISDSELLCLQNEKVKYVVALNEMSFNRFLPKLEEGGTMIVNSSLANVSRPRNDVKYVFAPLTQEAMNLGNSRLTNSIALGILLKLLGNISLESVKKAYETVLKKNGTIIEKNLEAYKLGYNYIKD